MFFCVIFCFSVSLCYCLFFVIFPENDATSPRKLVSTMASTPSSQGTHRLLRCELMSHGSDGALSRQQWLVAAVAGTGPARSTAIECDIVNQWGLEPWAAVALDVGALEAPKPAVSQDGTDQQQQQPPLQGGA